MIRLVLEQPTLEESGQILARSKLRAVMHRMGFADVRRETAELVCTEMLTNQIKYAEGSGLFQIWETLHPTPAIELFAIDYGPGIADLTRAHEDGFTTSGSMGRGLGAIRRLADQSAVYSVTRERREERPWSGVAVWARFLKTRLPETAIPVGAFMRAYRDACDNGDCICATLEAGQVRWLHLDGLGHGTEAARVVSGMEKRVRSTASPQSVLEKVSKAMEGGRGAVGVAAEVNVDPPGLHLCGVGDMTAAVLDREKRSLPFSPGVLGHAHRRFNTVEMELERGDLVITASDGVRKSWDAQSFPGLWQHHPQMIALVLGNVVGRSSDDKSVFAVRT